MTLALALVDTDQHVLAHQAVRQCLAGRDFDQLLIFTDRAEAFGGLPTVATPTLRGIADYNRLITRDLAEHLRCDHVLVAQYDGFVLNPQAFEPEFLAQDYIGAPWPGTDELGVGNGGFSLRSRRLVDAVARLPYDASVEAEDLFICRSARPLLERHAGLRFAPRALASRFSVEYPAVPHRTYGFHGVFHLPAVYRNDIDFLMRNLSDRLVQSRAGYLLPGLQAIGPHAVQLLQQRLAALLPSPAPSAGAIAERAAP